ncbi:MAG: hypothetical protein IIZ13_13955 [Renibacterium sp.]|nr:hypothetical protein [Renibacterium sp.]
MANFPVPPPLPPEQTGTGKKRGGRVLGIIVAVFGLIVLLVGITVFNSSSSGKNQAMGLQQSGLSGTVTDARIFIALDFSDGPATPPTARELELTYRGADGSSRTGMTLHYPKIDLSIYDKDGWYSDFDTKPQIVGQEVRYSADPPVVELASQLDAQANAGWNGGNIFGLVFGCFGAIVLLGGVLTALRGKP